VTLYPASASARDVYVLARRGDRPAHDPGRHQGLIVEDERAADGGIVRSATVLLTGRECPWRCAMCDLWQYTTATDTPRGAIPAQLRAARTALDAEVDPVTTMKLYNAGSFFDPRAVPEGDYDEIAAALGGLAHVIVESHPALIGHRVDLLRAALGARCGAQEAPSLEVAMGLETAHPEALDRLNKHVTLADFAAAAAALRQRAVALRVFLLVSPPFVPRAEQDEWLLRSIDAAFSAGASAVSLIPARGGNGAMESFAAHGWFSPPTLDDIERTAVLALTHGAARGRVFVDLWDLARFADCHGCLQSRRDRLHAMNLAQRVLPAITCTCPAVAGCR
jgi:radical SAM enzyme (TIGR01210 family)